MQALLWSDSNRSTRHERWDPVTEVSQLPQTSGISVSGHDTRSPASCRRHHVFWVSWSCWAVHTGCIGWSYRLRAELLCGLSLWQWNSSCVCNLQNSVTFQWNLISLLGVLLKSSIKIIYNVWIRCIIAVRNGKLLKRSNTLKCSSWQQQEKKYLCCDVKSFRTCQTYPE
jgi:hypothetical protein